MKLTLCSQRALAESRPTVLPSEVWLDHYALFQEGTMALSEAYHIYRQYCEIHTFTPEPRASFETKLAAFGIAKKQTKAGEVYAIRFMPAR